MVDFFFRTEDIKPESVGEFFVESKRDRDIVDALKNRHPTILVGSRGVGKSFLLRVAQAELTKSFQEDRIFPVYMSFVRGSLIQTSDPEQFKHWMLARICSAIVRSLMKAGLLSKITQSAKVLAGTDNPVENKLTKFEEIADQYENSWRNRDSPIDNASIPTVEGLKESIEDLGSELDINRFVLLFDEAAHIFLPEQQRQFFTLFRDLRSHCITCNAAVYPGVTSFGDTFQPVHDASMVSIDRDVLSSEYLENMREIVEKQADSTILRNIAQNGRNFGTLAFAASGNPRLLLKTIANAPKLNSNEINEVIRNYYRNEIWSEHSILADKYVGHREVIDWGRKFLESVVIPEIKSKNDQYLSADKRTSAYIWVHRDAPAIVKEALRILSYTGVLSEQAAGIKASRGEIGTRYILNLGCIFSLEATPAAVSFDVAKGLTSKRMTEFGANHPSYRSLVEQSHNFSPQGAALALDEQLKRSVAVLDISEWQRSKLLELGLVTIGDVLSANEEKLKEAAYVGNVRARRMRNAAVSAVLEYLSG